MKSPDRILIIRPDRLGDLILSLPVAETLKNHFPDSMVYYLAAPGPTQIAPFVPYVDQWLVDGDNRGILDVGRLTSVLRSAEFDCAVDLKPSLRTAAAIFLAGIETRIGTARRGYSIFYNRRVDVHRRASGRHQTDLDLELLAPLGIVARGVHPKLKLTPTAVLKAKELVVLNAKRYIVIHPGSGGSAPNWPLEHYKKLAVMIMKTAGRDVVITGHDDPIGNFDERCVNLNGKTDMEGLAGVLAGAELFISGSTGPLHLADVLGVRCMSFYINHRVVGPERWGPRRNMSNVVTPEIPCKCGKLTRCACLMRVTPEMAMDRLESILGS